METTTMDEQIVTCDWCQDTGWICFDFHDPGSFHGHGQYMTKCECQIEDEDWSPDLDL